METEHLQRLIQEVSESNLTHFEWEEKGSRILMKKEVVLGYKDTEMITSVRMNPSDAENDKISESAFSKTNEGMLITSPLVGVFYAAPGEDMDPFVQIGQSVKPGQTVAIVEAMKLMNEIECETNGIVTEILVNNGQSVEYGQPLFRIQPKEGAC